MRKSTILSLVHQLQSHDSEKSLEVQVGVQLAKRCPHCDNKGLHRHGVMPRRRALHAFVAGRWVYLGWASHVERGRGE